MLEVGLVERDLRVLAVIVLSGELDGVKGVAADRTQEFVLGLSASNTSLSASSVSVGSLLGSQRGGGMLLLLSFTSHILYVDE